MGILAALASGGPAAAGGVVHFVHVGGPDVCEFFGAKPGCDADWSLNAVQFDDGTVTGKLIDRSVWGAGVNGIVTCLIVDGNEAWISGTAWSFDRGKAEEIPFVTRVVDNGDSANELPDEVSFTWGIPLTCQEVYDDWRYALPVVPMTQGQVTVK